MGKTTSFAEIIGRIPADYAVTKYKKSQDIVIVNNEISGKHRKSTWIDYVKQKDTRHSFTHRYSLYRSYIETDSTDD